MAATLLDQKEAVSSFDQHFINLFCTTLVLSKAPVVTLVAKLCTGVSTAGGSRLQQDCLSNGRSD